MISPEPVKAGEIGVGEVGYLITGVKDVRQSRVGDTVTSQHHGATEPLGGYKHPNPMVFAGLYPIDGDDYPTLRDALERLQLNDAALAYEPETSGALGFGFRCGFLGLLHMEIVRERLEREFNLDLISTSPNVIYDVTMEDGTVFECTNPSEYPAGKVAEVREPVVRATILSPSDYIGTIMELCQAKRGQLDGMDYLSEDRVEMRYTLPMGEIVFDFFDQLKSRTKGYASLDYERTGDQASDLVKVDILLQGEPVDAFSRDRAQGRGVRLRRDAGRQAQGAHPAPAVRGPDPGRHRQPGDRPREHPRDPQGRAGQVLRRRHHPQAQAAREAEGGQEADEDGRPRRGPPGGVRRRALDHVPDGQDQEVTAEVRPVAGDDDWSVVAWLWQAFKHDLAPDRRRLPARRRPLQPHAGSTTWAAARPTPRRTSRWSGEAPVGFAVVVRLAQASAWHGRVLGRARGPPHGRRPDRWRGTWSTGTRGRGTSPSSRTTTAAAGFWRLVADEAVRRLDRGGSAAVPGKPDVPPDTWISGQHPPVTPSGSLTACAAWRPAGRRGPRGWTPCPGWSRRCSTSGS